MTKRRHDNKANAIVLAVRAREPLPAVCMRVGEEKREVDGKMANG